MAILKALLPRVDYMWNTHPICACVLVDRATVKAGTQEHGTEHGTERGTEIRCKVHHDERACMHCEGAHGYRHDCQVYSLAV